MARARAHHTPKKPRPSSTARWYGHEHRTLRKAWQERIDGGEVVICARCRLVRILGTEWDLGHNDADRRFYTGPECRPCNRATSTHRAQRQAEQESA